MGLVYHSQGQEQKALDSYSRALEIYQKLDNQRYIADTFDNMGIAYHGLGQEDKAKDFHNRAQAIYQKLDK
jgi:tetratricopeptide (TPR) repeat protein